jgi:hypothetical protein
MDIAEDHPLANYLKAIDNYLDDDSLLRVIGERIGIYVPDGENAAVYLHFKLREYLEKEKDIRRTYKLMHISPTEYEKYLINLDNKNKKLSRNDFVILYSNRLLNDVNI